MIKNKISRAGEPASAQLQNRPNPSRRILVVDDEPYIRQLCAKALIHSGYKVAAAADCASAWQLLHTERYDLLITDHNMPRVSGIKLFKKLRADCMALPVIMSTGISLKEEFARYPWLQPAAMLLKPYTVAKLLETVKEVLHATNGTHAQIAPPPNWRSQPSALGLHSCWVEPTHTPKGVNALQQLCVS